MTGQRFVNCCFFFLLLSVSLVYSAEEIRLFNEQVNIPERGLVTAFVLKVQTNRFTFLAPPEWRVTCEASESKIVLLSKDLSMCILIHVRSIPKSTDKPLEINLLRKKIKQRFANARIVTDFPCYCSSQQGHAFQLERTAVNDVRMSSCIAFYYIGGWEIEFEFTTTTKHYKERFQFFANLMGSFQVKPPDVDTKTQGSSN